METMPLITIWANSFSFVTPFAKCPFIVLSPFEPLIHVGPAFVQSHAGFFWPPFNRVFARPLQQKACSYQPCPTQSQEEQREKPDAPPSQRRCMSTKEGNNASEERGKPKNNCILQSKLPARKYLKHATRWADSSKDNLLNL